MIVEICSKCGTKLAVSPEGLCNICDPNALSKRLKLEAQQEENDLAYLGKMKKQLRQARLEKFEEGYQELLEANDCIVIPFDGNKVVIDTQTEKFGVVDYYPKANKLLIRKDNKWLTQGLVWINNNLIKK